MFADPALVASRLIFIGLLIEAAEMFALRRAFDDGGVFSRGTLKLLTKGTRRLTRAGATTGGSAVITSVMAVQALAALVALIQGTGTALGITAALTCLAANAFLRARRQIGSSGAEQLTFIVLVTFGLVMAAGGDLAARRIGDAFIAAQVTLAYFASGVSKAASPTWRSGRAMSAILGTEGYGVPPIAAALTRYPILDRFLCWSVIVWESTFALALFAPAPVLVAMLAVGVVFHATCAVVMGLNRFVWAFCGCYPAVWATAILLRA